MNASFPFLVVNETMKSYVAAATVTLTDDQGSQHIPPYSRTLTEAAFVSALVFFSIQFS